MRRPEDISEDLEAALGRPPARCYLLCLYVSGSTPKSAVAIKNIRAICEERLKGRFKLEVIDIYQHPEKVKSEQIVIAPTLVKKLPPPVRKIIGDLSNTERVLMGLDVVLQPISQRL